MTDDSPSAIPEDDEIRGRPRHWDLEHGMIRKHSVSLHGHRTSFSLEEPFWDELKAIAAHRAIPIAALISQIDETRAPETNLSSALRLHVLDVLKASAPSS